MNSWYKSPVDVFLSASLQDIYFTLDKSAREDGYSIESEQKEEWEATIGVVKKALARPGLGLIKGILAEYNFRRRGLRIDFVLLAPGAVFVVEFKRGDVTQSAKDQAMRYAKNLLEFHDITQQLRPKVYPIVVTRKGEVGAHGKLGFSTNRPELNARPLCCSASDLGQTIENALNFARNEGRCPSVEEWDSSAFSPSTQIIDAAIALYGRHEVGAISAIKSQQEAALAIARCADSVRKKINDFTSKGENGLIIVTGEPGAGKTLVGLDTVFNREFVRQSVFVTGNAPLVEVLTESLSRSYRRLTDKKWDESLGGFPRDEDGFVEDSTTFNIVNAHSFLSDKEGQQYSGSEGRILVFDEAQRTLSEGKEVNRERLEKHEAYLVIEKMMKRPGAIIVLLLGHNQNINTKELGATIWFRAAKEYKWKCAISAESAKLPELELGCAELEGSGLLESMEGTHLKVSVRNRANIEPWVRAVLELNDPAAARAVMEASSTDMYPVRVHLSRDLEKCRTYIRQNYDLFDERAGLLAAGQGKRLRADGIRPDYKPDIADWMLRPSNDIRSSNMLEEVQNQYQIQGLEIDHAVVCWDLDLRREEGNWACYNVNGDDWQRGSTQLESRINSYRVLLTRSRISMIIYVPMGAEQEVDATRDAAKYQQIADYILECGAIPLEG
jgi:hypothetical protein